MEEERRCLKSNEILKVGGYLPLPGGPTLSNLTRISRRKLTLVLFYWLVIFVAPHSLISCSSVHIWIFYTRHIFYEIWIWNRSEEGLGSQNDGSIGVDQLGSMT